MANDNNDTFKAIVTGIGRWASLVVMGLLVPLLIWVGRTVYNVDRSVTQILVTLPTLKEQVSKNRQWIEDWYNILKVPERDTAQDDAIAQHTKVLDHLVERVERSEILINQLGGPKDPLMGYVLRLERRIERLEDTKK